MSRTERMCLRKRRFSTETFAKGVARRFGENNGQTPQRAYKCPHCLDWHLTTKL